MEIVKKNNESNDDDFSETADIVCLSQDELLHLTKLEEEEKSAEEKSEKCQQDTVEEPKIETVTNELEKDDNDRLSYLLNKMENKSNQS